MFSVQQIVFSILILYCILLVVNANSTLIWQGFKHEWERKVFKNFSTPHRLGSVSNYLFYNSTSAFVKQTFTPGVNGDYAHPITYYTSLSNTPFIAQHATGFSSWNDFTKTDPKTGLPEAKSMAKGTVLFNATLSSYNKHQYTALLDGYDIQMFCNPKLQPAGKICNSNGIWPYILSINISKPFTYDLARVGVNYTIVINRAWDPLDKSLAGFIKKEFNYVMSFNLSLPVQLIASSSLYTDNSTQVSVKTEIEYPSAPATVSTSLFKPVSSSQYPIAVTGISGFSIKQYKVANISTLGRYWEDFDFHLRHLQDLPSSSLLSLTMGVGTTKTTVPIQYEATISTNLLQFKQSSMQAKESSVTGTICFNDEAFPFTFRCLLRGMHANPSYVGKVPSST